MATICVNGNEPSREAQKFEVPGTSLVRTMEYRVLATFTWAGKPQLGILDSFILGCEHLVATLPHIGFAQSAATLDTTEIIGDQALGVFLRFRIDTLTDHTLY